MSVDIATAAWLKANALIVEDVSATVAAAWGDLATISEITSPLALKADALVEAARQHGFLLSASAPDKVEVAGLRNELIGRPIDFTGDRAGYEGGVRVFVIAAEEQTNVDRTVLTVLRRLE